MKKIGSVVLLAILSGALVGCGDAEGGSVPKLSSVYQKKFEVAWTEASNGKNPTASCASVVGTAVGMVSSKQGKKAEAVQAYEACYVDAFVKYANVYMSTGENGNLNQRNEPQGCMSLSVAFGIHTRALGTFAKDLALDPALLTQKLHAGLGSTASLCKKLT